MWPTKESYRHQFAHVGSKNAGDSSSDTLLFATPSIYALGRRSTLDNLNLIMLDVRTGKENGNNFDIVRVERGGEVTTMDLANLLGINPRSHQT